MGKDLRGLGGAWDVDVLGSWGGFSKDSGSGGGSSGHGEGLGVMGDVLGSWGGSWGLGVVDP